MMKRRPTAPLFALLFCLFFSAEGRALESDFKIEGRTLVRYAGRAREVAIPDGVSRIGRRAFFGTEVYAVKVPVGVAAIDEEAFSGCAFLRSVRLPNTLASIGRRAFFNCGLLAELNIPRSLRSIGAGAFFNCRSLPAVELPDSVRAVGDRAFAGCIGLERLSLSRRTDAAKRAFMGVRCAIEWRD
jgi:hypothetical protein